MNILEKITPRRRRIGEKVDVSFPLDEMTKILGFVPHHPEVYKLSLIARSAIEVDKDGNRINNERLEYLGDAILEAIVSDIIYNHFPQMPEGFMTVLRSQLVKRDMLNGIGEKIGLGQFIKGKKAKPCRNIYGNALEALIGAVFLDRGYETCKTFVRTRLYAHVNLDKLAEREENFKSHLMEWGQKNKRHISFEVFDEEPQPPNTTQFFAKVYIDGVEYGSGVGVAKRKAEQAASKQALRLIEMGK